jgi:hypothetical protein
MNQFEASSRYVEARTLEVIRRVRDDERGSATAEQIVMIGAAVIGAAAVGVIIWNKMRSGAESIQTPSP